jgi:hypothetical protein
MGSSISTNCATGQVTIRYGGKAIAKTEIVFPVITGTVGPVTTSVNFKGGKNDLALKNVDSCGSRRVEVIVEFDSPVTDVAPLKGINCPQGSGVLLFHPKRVSTEKRTCRYRRAPKCRPLRVSTIVLNSLPPDCSSKRACRVKGPNSKPRRSTQNIGLFFDRAKLSSDRLTFTYVGHCSHAIDPGCSLINFSLDTMFNPEVSQP